MATYRYILADLLTNTVVAELPLFSVSFSRVLSFVGNFQATFILGSSDYTDQEILDATIPGRTAIYVERTNVGSGQKGYLVWGGVLWSRSWEEEGQTFNITGQTFESFPYAEDIQNSLTYAGMDQRNILISLINAMQAYTDRNIGIIVPSTFSDHIVRTQNFFNYEGWSFGKAIEFMVGYDQGFDYTIEVGYDTNGIPIKTLRTDDVLGAPVATTQLAFDYPGNIKTFWFPENAANGANTVVGFGAGEGSAMVRSRKSNPRNGYPELVQFFTNKDVSVQATLDSQTQAELTRVAVPVNVPTFEVNPDMTPLFGEYLLGDFANFKLVSHRFPKSGGYETSARIIGWEVTPGESDNQENVKLVIANEDTSQ